MAVTFMIKKFCSGLLKVNKIKKNFFEIPKADLPILNRALKLVCIALPMPSSTIRSHLFFSNSAAKLTGTDPKLMQGEPEPFSMTVMAPEPINWANSSSSAFQTVIFQRNFPAYKNKKKKLCRCGK